MGWIADIVVGRMKQIPLWHSVSGVSVDVIQLSAVLDECYSAEFQIQAEIDRRMQAACDRIRASMSRNEGKE